MDGQQIFIFIVLGGIFIAFALELLSPQIIALGAAIILLLVGILSFTDIFHCLSNPAPLTIACLLILTSALERTGQIERLGQLFNRIARNDERRALAIILIGCTTASAFVNNTPLVVLMLPIIFRFCEESRTNPSKLLIPLSFATILGGTCSIAGTSTNVLINGLMGPLDLPSFSIFSIAPLGIIYAAVGCTYLWFFSPKMLPVRIPPKAHEDTIRSNNSKPYNLKKAKYAWIGSGIFILLSSLPYAQIDVRIPPLDILKSSFIAALFVLLTGCLRPAEVIKAVNWKLLVLIIGMLAVGTALNKSGAALTLATGISQYAEPYGPIIILSGIYLFATLLTELISNSAVAIILTPIVVHLAKSLEVSPIPFVVAIMFAASASFITPIGYQTNTLVYTAGAYKFKDFIRIGLPLNLLLWITASILIPLLWEF